MLNAMYEFYPPSIAMRMDEKRILVLPIAGLGQIINECRPAQITIKRRQINVIQDTIPFSFLEKS